MSNKYGRALVGVLAVVGVVVLTLVLVTRGGAVTTTPSGVSFVVAPATYVVRTLPLNTPVSISVSETGGGSTATTTIVACSDGVAWSWIGLNGGGTVAQGHNSTATNTTMCTTLAGPYVLTVSAAAGTIRVVAGSSTARVYINY